MRHLFIGENPKLEAVFEDASPGVCAVITHPHSLMGGDMSNNVVMAAWSTAVEKGFSALRFNFRGVGRSLGSFDEGIGETEDLATAVRFAGRPVVVIGYSFGAWIAARFLQETDVPCILISPPTAMFSFPSLKGFNAWSVVGSEDRFCNRENLFSIQDSERISIVGGVDHFWFGYENLITDFLGAELDFLAPGGSLP